MILPSLPNECLSDVLTFLDGNSLNKCLFVSRQYCKLSIPIIWRNPLKYNRFRKSAINTLLACLDEDEISSLIPCAININNQSTLFEYGKFIRAIDHEDCVYHIATWLELSSGNDINKSQDCRVQKLVNVIYHAIIRQGSNLKKIKFYSISHSPKISILTTYNPAITNLRSIV